MTYNFAQNNTKDQTNDVYNKKIQLKYCLKTCHRSKRNTPILKILYCIN